MYYTLPQFFYLVDLQYPIVSMYSKACVKQPLYKRPKLVFKTNYRQMQIKSVAECSKGSILQYFRPSLSYHLSLRSLFCLFLSNGFTQVLLYIQSEWKTIWLLIRWLHQKPADLDLECFKKKRIKGGSVRQGLTNE